ncbi:Tripartite motif containing 37 [Cichlidogyrus casuarinus]|uniref:Tripartite motif containing 37 n=1 Tax=Cichlidogyrus casuarinus TaxID=1844966 RepID=A0ABD2PQK4_9PLAT
MQSRAQCPHCLNTLHLMDLVHCRWAEEITQRLSQLQNMDKSRDRSADSNGDKCKSHDEVLSVYCATCNRVVCHQCALFDNQHDKHQFRPLDEVVKQKIKDLSSDIQSLEQRRTGLASIVHQVNGKISTLMQAKDERLSEIKVCMDLAVNRLESDCKMRLSKLLSHKHRVLQESRVLDTLQQELLTALDQLSKARMISFCEDFKSVFSKIHSQSLDLYQCPEVSDHFVNQIVPPFDNALVQLADFSACQQRAEPVFSEPLLMSSGLSWRLKFYPNGNGTVKNSYLSIFLELSGSSAGSVPCQGASKYEYRIEMVNPGDPTKNVSREFASDFEVGECWGYNRFFQLDRLVPEGFLPNDTLTIRFQLRSPSYQAKCRDLHNYVQQLELRQGELLRQVQELRPSSSSHSESQTCPPHVARVVEQTQADEADADSTTGQNLQVGQLVLVIH